MRIATAIVVAAALSACSGIQHKAAPAPAPVVIEVPVKVYVPIKRELTQRCRWVREDVPSKVFGVSNGRKKCLEQYESRLDAIEKLQGKPVPEGEQ